MIYSNPFEVQMLNTHTPQYLDILGLALLIQVPDFLSTTRTKLWWGKEAQDILIQHPVVQWSACGHDNPGSRVLSPDIHWPLFYLC